MCRVCAHAHLGDRHASTESDRLHRLALAQLRAGFRRVDCMASFTLLRSGAWRVQVRRKGRYVAESFLRKTEGPGLGARSRDRYRPGLQTAPPASRLPRRARPRYQTAERKTVRRETARNIPAITRPSYWIQTATISKRFITARPIAPRLPSWCDSNAPSPAS